MTDQEAIELAKARGFELNPVTNKWWHPESSARYCNTPRWGRYALEDHPKLVLK